MHSLIDSYVRRSRGRVIARDNDDDDDNDDGSDGRWNRELELCVGIA